MRITAPMTSSSRREMPPTRCIICRSGKAKITVTSENGKEAVLAIIGPGDFFGEGCMNGQSRRMATVTAIDGMLDHAAGKGRHGARAA